MVLLAALATGACGAGSGSDATGDVSESASSAAASSAEPSPTVSAAPTAADGTDYAACDDGSCEVAVSGAVEFGYDDFTLMVTITADGIETYTANSDNSSSGASNMSGSGMSEAYCIAYLTASSNSMSCYPDSGEDDVPDPESEPGVLVLEMIDFAEGTAIIRLTMG